METDIGVKYLWTSEFPQISLHLITWSVTKDRNILPEYHLFETFCVASGFSLQQMLRFSQGAGTEKLGIPSEG